MPKVKLDVGATVDFLNKDELDDELAKNQARAEAIDRERLSGVKYMRPRGSVGTVGVRDFGVRHPGHHLAGPAEGYAWSVRRIAVGGLAKQRPTRHVGIYRNTDTVPRCAQVTANSPKVISRTWVSCCSAVRLLARAHRRSVPCRRAARRSARHRG